MEELVKVCKTCFYNYRSKNVDITSFCNPSHKAERIIVQWNDYEGFYETTSIRIPPSHLSQKVMGYVRLCDPNRGTCRNDLCTYAHGRNEQRHWNNILRQQRERQQGVTRVNTGTNSVRLPQNNRDLPLFSQEWPELTSHGFKETTQSFLIPKAQQHNVPSAMTSPRKHDASSESFEERVKNPLSMESIKIHLTASSYKEKFHNLICWEEKTHIELLGEKCNSICNMTVYQSGHHPHWIRRIDPDVRIGCIEGLSQDSIAYATQASEAAFAVSTIEQNQDIVEMRMEILRENYEHHDDNLYVAFKQRDENLLSKICSWPITQGKTCLQNVSIEFEVKHLFFNNLIRAVNEIQPQIIERLFPTLDKFQPLCCTKDFEKQFLPPSSLVDSKLDKVQSDSLKIILATKSESPPVLINGAFGTGKTRLLAVTSYCLIKQGRIQGKPARVLVCAHHQATADNFVEKYFGPMLKTLKFELVRLTSSNYRFESKFSDCYNTVPVAKKKYARESPQYIIVATTFLTAPSLKRIFRRDFFTHILMDEGSQSREPEAIAPLSLASCTTKLVIAGDPQQVGPALLVLGKEARDNGLKYSLLERLSKWYIDLGDVGLNYLVKLNNNYRCHSKIMEVPNQLFYDNKCESSGKDEAHPLAPYPLIFICSSLDDKVNPELESKVLLEKLHQMIQQAEKRHRQSDDFALITASRPQLVCTRKMAKTQKKIDHFKVSWLTSYTLQGKEFRYLFISTVESLKNGKSDNPTKSLCDKYVFNTVLTRSKSLVVVAGSPYSLLQTESLMGEKTNCWKKYMESCIQKGTFIVPESVEADKNKRNQFLANLRTILESPSISPRSLARNESANLPSRPHQLSSQSHMASSVMTESVNSSPGAHLLSSQAQLAPTPLKTESFIPGPTAYPLGHILHSGQTPARTGRVNPLTSCSQLMQDPSVITAVVSPELTKHSPIFQSHLLPALESTMTGTSTVSSVINSGMLAPSPISASSLQKTPPHSYILPQDSNSARPSSSEKMLKDEVTRLKEKLEQTEKYLADSDRMFRESRSTIQDLEKKLKSSEEKSSELLSRVNQLQRKLEEAATQSDQKALQFQKMAEEWAEASGDLTANFQTAEKKAEELEDQLKLFEQTERELKEKLKEFTKKSEESEKKEKEAMQQLENTNTKFCEAEKALLESNTATDNLKAQIEELKCKEDISLRKAEYSEKRAEELENKLENILEESKKTLMESKSREEILDMKEKQLLVRELALAEREKELERETEVRELALAEREKELERETEELRNNVKKAEAKAHEFENTADDAKQRLTQVEGRLNLVEQNLIEKHQSFEQLNKQWVVKESEIQFTEEDELGSGGWGAVRVAIFRGTRVAAKTIHKEIHSEHNRQVFLREMNMAARLRHPNLVQFIGATLEGNMVILSELLPFSLRIELERESIGIPPSQACCIGMDVAQALNYLHLMEPEPFIHRDISSANVLLEPLLSNKWKAKVADYGSVNLQCQLKTHNPGSPLYSAPEACNPKEQSTKMDIYSFGALLLEMLSGELPALSERSRLFHYVRKEKLKELIQDCLLEDRSKRPDANAIIVCLTSIQAELSKKR